MHNEAGEKRPLWHTAVRKRPARAVLAALAMLLATASCWATPAEESPRVVASIPPIHSLVAGVMQGVAAPSLIVRGYGSPHTYRMRPSDAARLHGADLVFWVGSTLETFLEKPLSSLPESARVVPLMETAGLTLLENRQGGPWGHHGAHSHQHGHAYGAADTDGASTTSRDWRRYNPHIWLDPENARQLLGAMARHLAEVDPAHAARYRINAEALSRRVEELADQIEEQLSGLGSIPYLVFHDAYPYLEARYGLRAAGSVTTNPGKLPSVRRIADLRATVARLNIRCIFREPQFDAGFVETTLGDKKVTIGVLDPLGIGEEPGPELWFRIMQTHARVIGDCLSSARPKPE
uniref:High-affinity zinc uptake system protein ZnuA n=1 Tax=Candidatus Kentrum sp. DK TaxID=2126562 RepID=A0A450SJV1_9GAMM|nr:MAG: zinc transport system substrate-binding protein [Candidatus Kentron sp. DK]VFJ53772.1 MAG: zinc transport system substrate-binding protein [Candidatus Kentron sp. DK]